MKYVENIDKEIESIAKKMVKGKKSVKKSTAPEEFPHLLDFQELWR